MMDKPVKIGDIIWKSLDTIEFKKDIYPKLIESQWHYILGPTLVQHCKFQKFEQGILYIKVNSAEWYRELNELKSQLIDKFNRYFNKIILTEIEFTPAYAKPRTRPRIKTTR
jgi:predicted nucleic acid-binding Zn ribbon protein